MEFSSINDKRNVILNKNFRAANGTNTSVCITQHPSNTFEFNKTKSWKQEEIKL